MKKWIFCFPVVVLFIQCSLNASQEQALNTALGRYIQARNECMTTGLVGFTHPSLVKDFQLAGDSAFTRKFDCVNNPEYYYAIQNATLRTSASEGDVIQVLYEFDGYGEMDDEYKKRNFKLVAISENNGVNWFFIPWTDYSNDTLCKGVDRLLK